MVTLKPKILVGLALICAVLAAGRTVAADSFPSVAKRNSGVWQEHRYSFEFIGFTSTYSCDGLASKLKTLLIASGARADAKVQAGACAAGFGRADKFARADLTFYTLTPVHSAEDTAQPTEGVWRLVYFTVHQPATIGPGDCELVEQFKSTVLPMFNTHDIDDRTTCVPREEAGSIINLKFESFAESQGISP